jgi:hypothetical protein
MADTKSLFQVLFLLDKTGSPGAYVIKLYIFITDMAKPNKLERLFTSLRPGGYTRVEHIKGAPLRTYSEMLDQKPTL